MVFLRMERKGQVSIYIIIGLIILISFLILVYLRGVGSKDDVSESLQNIPVSFKPLQRYVEHNLEVSLTQAIKNLGQHSGYVDPYVYATLPNLESPTESSALKPFSNSNRIYPYWYYMDSPNQCDTCNFKTLMPGLKRSSVDNQSVEAQIDRYLQTRMNALDFTDFKFQNIDVEIMKGAQVITTISGGTVQAVLELPLLAKKDSEEFKLTKFKASVPVELPRMFELAKSIAVLERDKRFIEEHVLNMLSTYSGVDKERLPIMGSDIEFGGSPIYWNVLDVKDQVSKEVLSKVSGLRIPGTGNFGTGAVTGGDFQDIEVYFTFPDNRPFYFRINSLPKGIVGPSTTSQDVAFFKFVINHYVFKYDISFPVLVTLKMLGGLNGEDYTFQFAVEGNVRANKPLFDGESPLAPENGHTMMCEDNQALSGDITIRARGTSNSPIAGADIYYNCAGQGCYIGQTDSTGVLKTRLPVCIGGLVVPVKERFIGEPKGLDTKLSAPGMVELQMADTKAFKLDVKKLVFTQEDGKWPHEKTGFSSQGITPTVVPLENDESVIVIFKRVADGGVSTYQFPAEVIGGAELPEVYLAEGEYQVDMLLMKSKQLVIPEKTCPEITILPCTPTEEIVMDEMQYGGGKLGSFKLDNMGAETITIYSLYFDIFGIEDLEATDLNVIASMEAYAPYLAKYKPVLNKW
jgi:hypothetical protein